MTKCKYNEAAIKGQTLPNIDRLLAVGLLYFFLPQTVLKPGTAKRASVVALVFLL